MDKKYFKQQLLSTLYTSCFQRTECPVGTHSCKQLVFGEGNPDAHLMLIGEAPGKDEDEEGKPFVGRSGKLLTTCLERAGCDRKTIFITNLVKCRPPHNRTPLPNEVVLFKPLLIQEINIVRPKVICTLGASALQGLLEQQCSITKLRGKQLTYQGIPLIPTYHPAYVLRNQAAEHDLQADITYAFTLSKTQKSHNLSGTL
jgi:uracil-DNA glycosylase